MPRCSERNFDRLVALPQNTECFLGFFSVSLVFFFGLFLSFSTSICCTYCTHLWAPYWNTRTSRNRSTLQILESFIQAKWKSLPLVQRDGKTFMQFISKLSESRAESEKNSLFLHNLNLVLVQSQIRELGDEADRAESQIESLSSVDARRRGKKEEGKKGEKEKRMEDLKRHPKRMKFHIGKLEVISNPRLWIFRSQVCLRMVNNESLESKRVMEVLEDSLKMYVDALVDPDCDGDTDHLETLDLEGAQVRQRIGGDHGNPRTSGDLDTEAKTRQLVRLHVGRSRQHLFQLLQRSWPTIVRPNPGKMIRMHCGARDTS